MTSYRVSFFKDVLSSDGHLFKCLQQAVEIRDARSVDRAVQTAKRQYQDLRGLHDWRLHADYLELEIDGKKVDYCPKETGIRGGKVALLSASGEYRQR